LMFSLKKKHFPEENSGIFSVVESTL
jgi:hypothetical protein